MAKETVRVSNGLKRHLPTATVVAATALTLGITVLPANAAPDEPDTVDEAKAQVDRAYHQAEQATERYHGITDRVKDAKSQIKSLRQDVATQQKAYSELREAMGGTIAHQLTESPMGPTSELLTADDPTDFLDGLAALQSYSSNQSDRLDELGESASELKVRKKQLASELEVVKDGRADMRKEVDKRETSLAEAKDVLDKLTAEERARVAAAAAAAENDAEADTGGGDNTAGDGDSSGDSGGSAPSSNVPASGRAKVAIDFAMSQIGDPYVYGATGPDSWDCSGLTGAAWRAAGVSLPRSSSQQAGVGTSVSLSSAQPGDLVFYYSPISHVALYIGGGKIVHASRPGVPVGVASVDSMPISSIRRVG